MSNARLLPLAVLVALIGTSLPALPAQAGLSEALPTPPQMPLSVSPEAAGWKTAVIGDVKDFLPAAPPVWGTPAAKAEMAEIVDWQKRRSADDLKAISYWNDVPPPLRWSEEVRAEIITASMVPPRGARALALVHAAMYDATVVTWKAKALHHRPLPAQVNPFLKPVAGEPGIPSYPSEHAAISMAAAMTLAELFPDHKEALLKKARLVGETRVAAGAAFRSDIEAGFAIGEKVAKAVLAARGDDGANRPNPPVAKLPGKWWVEAPMESGAGQWRTWMLKNGQQFRMHYDWQHDMKNPTFAKAYREVDAIHDTLTPHQIERAIFWNFDVPAILWNDIARRAVLTKKKPIKPDSMGIIWSDIARRAIANQVMDTPHAARMLNVLHMTLADAFIACWDTKYANRVPRPIMVAPAGKSLRTVVPTPPHPSWPSGHATASMAASVVLRQYFPQEAKAFEAQAREAAMSRLWGGIHFRKDNDDGLKLGERIGKHCVSEAKAKGWLP
ncbi:MAG: phosphatase PAP2 family protein [Candidatus Sericytochromatia bacterium]|nr:phosphatase PAP2 family protein [Candidatus Sericytochromatia bacterium]